MRVVEMVDPLTASRRRQQLAASVGGLGWFSGCCVKWVECLALCISRLGYSILCTELSRLLGDVVRGQDGQVSEMP
jgi:hypothetical protein